MGLIHFWQKVNSKFEIEVIVTRKKVLGLDSEWEHKSLFIFHKTTREATESISSHFDARE